MKYSTTVCTITLLTALFAVTPVSGDAATRGVVKKDITTTNMKSPLNNSHIQALEALSMHRNEKNPRRDDSSRQLRKDSKSAKNAGCLCGSDSTDVLAANTHKEDLDHCMQDLEEAKKPVPSYLYVQMADVCVFKQDEDGSVSIHSNSFLEDTEQFSNKPFRLESTVPTEEFFAEFDTTFFPGDKPNSAITLVDKGESEGVVVSVFASAFNATDGEGKTVYGYKLTQSDEQEGVNSLKNIMDGNDVKEYVHCSVFIDCR
jgi:hypothetical protein